MNIKFITQEEDAARRVEELFRINGIVSDGSMSAIEIANRLSSNQCEYWLDRFITQDDEMKAMKDECRELVYQKEPVLITGPTGTGKELIAHALHGNREGDFLPLNCAGLPEHLVESELFGHVRGSFTDAHKDNLGAFREAGEGTVFLDEIAEMTPRIQAKLLRAIQENEVRPVGSSKSVPISCRFISATKYDLEKRVEANLFRDDLFARLMTFELKTTSLVSRPADIFLILCWLQVPEEKRNLNDFWMHRVEKYNVRALVAYASRVRVFGKVD